MGVLLKFLEHDRFDHLRVIPFDGQLIKDIFTGLLF